MPVEFGLETLIGGFGQIIKIDTTHVLCAYQSRSDSHGQCRIATLGADGWVLGSEYEFNGTTIGNKHIGLLDSTHALLYYTYWDGDSYVARCCRVTFNTSTGVITYGTRYDHGTNSDASNLIVLTSTTAVIGYRISNTPGYKVVTLNGDVVTYNTEYNYPTTMDNGMFTQMKRLDDTHFIGISKATWDTISFAVRFTVTGTVITWGSAYEVLAASTSNINPVPVVIDSTHVLCVFGEVWPYGTWPTHGLCQILTLNGDVISQGTYYEFSTLDYEEFAIDLLDSTHFLILAKEWASSVYSLKAIMGFINGGVISYGTLMTLKSNTSTSYLRVCAVDSGEAMIGYTYNPGTTGDYINGSYKGWVLSAEQNGQNIDLSWIQDW